MQSEIWSQETMMRGFTYAISWDFPRERENLHNMVVFEYHTRVAGVCHKTELDST
jgi:hypothetical protein